MILELGAIVAGGFFLMMNRVLNSNDAERGKLATSKMGNCKDKYLTGLTGDDGIILTKNIQLNEKACYEHIGVIGPTGSGKTTSIFFPNLLSNNLHGSVVVMDPKGELYRKTAKYQKSIGRETLLFAPLEPDISLKYNPLEQCKDAEEVMELGQNLLMNGALALEIKTGKAAGGMEWIQMATPLFVAALLYCRDLGRPFNTIDNALQLVINNDADELDRIFRDAHAEAKTQYRIFKTCIESPRTMSSIKITLTTNLELFTDSKLSKSISRSDFSPEQLRGKPTCLYIMYPERKANYLSPFTACFFSQFIDRVIDSYKDDSLPVYFLWDEFANCGQLSNFSQNIATVRSRKMSFLICLQSITQLSQLYGRDNSLSILNNLKTKVILPGLTDSATVNFVSELCGYTEVNTMSQSSND
jgi:type IV secretion system protein VirD4